ncbi:hypothetical protein STAQ_40950 [Allostella sp. ATCC 35155]|nr:hypothetical protein STAQ_40950 [Stella sp. ATCC 35155]
MNGNEFIRRLRVLAKADGVPVDLDEAHGKGSHATLTYGSRRTTIKDRRKELGLGLMRKMCRDLGIDPNRLG